MADVLAFSSKKKQGADTAIRKVLWGVIIMLVIFSAAELFFHFFIAPRIMIKNIVISNDTGLSEQEILRLAGISGKEYYFLINAAQMRERLMTHPLVKGAAVEKIFPNTLKLTLTGRVPLMVVLVDYDNRTVPLSIDEEGVVFQIGVGVSNLNLPVLSGLRFDKLEQGMRLPPEMLPLLRDFKRISRSEPGLQSLISEIKAVKTDAGDFEYVVYPVNYAKGVLVGRRLDASIIKYMFIALNLLDQEGMLQKVRDLDFRTGELVYRMKEE